MFSPLKKSMFDPEKLNQTAFSYYPGLRKVEQYVHNNQCESISLRKAAQLAGLEEKYFSAYFRAKTGVCFKDWLTHLRVTLAVDLIRDHNESITNIAFSVGFRDLRTFERVFKKHMGLTPQAFKLSARPS
jgi:AraC-like DNA-binding protein